MLTRLTALLFHPQIGAPEGNPLLLLDPAGKTLQ